MKKQWRMIGNLAGVTSFFRVGACAMGKVRFEAPQYVPYNPDSRRPLIPA
jgi:hypothetical protein